MSEPNLNESTQEICAACNGDGGWCDTYIGRDHNVRSDWYWCDACGGKGWYEVEAEPVEFDYIADCGDPFAARS